MSDPSRLELDSLHYLLSAQITEPQWDPRPAARLAKWVKWDVVYDVHSRRSVNVVS